MRVLLDTHVFPWYITGNARLSSAYQELVCNPGNEVYLSVVSLWDAIVKHQLGKLPLPEPPEVYLPKQRERHLIEGLPLNEASVSHLAQLPPLHRDPFDRMLICQAMANNLTIATVDPAIRAYPITVVKDA